MKSLLQGWEVFETLMCCMTDCGIACFLQLRRNLRKLLFTLTIWHAVNSPMLERVPVMAQAGGGPILYSPVLLACLLKQLYPYSHVRYGPQRLRKDGSFSKTYDMKRKQKQQCGPVAASWMSLPCAGLAKVNPTSEKQKGTGKSIWERGNIRRRNPELLKRRYGHVFPLLSQVWR